MLKRIPVPLVIAAVGLLILPSTLLALGLTVTSATEVVVFGIAAWRSTSSWVTPDWYHSGMAHGLASPLMQRRCFSAI